MNVVAIWCAAALGFLLFGMGWPISGLRRRENRYIGFDPDPTNLLHKSIRAHANTAEYVPLLAVLILYLGAHDPAPWVVWTMVAATMCRYVFVIGMIAFPTMAKPNPVRFVGAGGTYVCGLMLSYALLQNYQIMMRLS